MQSRHGETASQKAHSTGDFAIPWENECQAIYAAVHRTAVARISLSLGLADDIVDAIVNEQSYDIPHALSCLGKKGIEMLMSVIHKPGGMKSGTQNPVISDKLIPKDYLGHILCS